MSSSVLDLRCCDYDTNSTNTESLRKWVHNTYKYVYKGSDIPDEVLNKMSKDEIKEFVEELDWLASK